MTREITHMKAFMIALESMGKDPLSIGAIPPTPGVVDEYFDDSTGEGEYGAVNSRGPWNSEENGFRIVEAPAFLDVDQITNGKAKNGKPAGGKTAKKR